MTTPGPALERSVEPEQAVDLAEEGLRVRCVNWPGSHWRVAEVKSVLGMALARGGESMRAEQLLREGAEVLQEVLGPGSSQTEQAVECLEPYIQPRRDSEGAS